MKILLIAGHGGGDVGAVGCGYQEYNLTREVVKLLKPSLEKYADVVIADTNYNWYEHICKKGNVYSFKEFDYVLEIHFNACVKDYTGNGHTTGTEFYVTTSEKGTTVEELILKNISALGFKNRGVKRKNYSLINYIKKQGVSSALLEVCFIDDLDDIMLYKEKKQQIVDAISEGIKVGFGLEEKPSLNKEIKSPYAIATELKKYITIYDFEGFVKALEKAQKEGSALYWGYYKIVNNFK